MDETIECKQYTKEAVTNDIWQEIRHFVEDAASYAHDDFIAHDVLLSLHKGDHQAWVVRDNGVAKFVWITEVHQHTCRRFVIVLAAAGEMEYGWKFWPWMSQWMLGNGIEEADVYCRPSMGRLLRRHGLQTRYEVLTIKPLEA